VLSERERAGDSAATFLVGVVVVLRAKLPAVDKRPQEISEFCSLVTIRISRMPAVTSVRMG
jgi:hypothetical protein